MSMAKKRKMRRSASPFAGFKRTRRSHRASGGGNQSLVRMILPALVYGAVRQKISGMVQPITTQFAGPLGNIADEATMIGVAVLAKKFVKNPMVSQMANAAIMIEAAQIGQAIASGQVLPSQQAFA